MSRRAARRAALGRAGDRLDALGWYPRPVRRRAVALLYAPWFFRIPGFRKYDGYATYAVIFTRHDPALGDADDLIAHELCHVWQMQHRPLSMPLSYVRHGYWNNPYEIEAREAARARPSTGVS